MKLSTRFISSKKQAGLTLIELISSLAIMALVIGGALMLYGSASTSQNTTQTISEINAMRTSIKGLYYGQGGYGATASTSLNTVLVNGNKVPTTINVVGTVLTNSFGGDIAVASGPTVNSNVFNVTITKVPTAICVSVLSSANGWIGVKTGATDHTLAAATLPVSPTTAATDCSGQAVAGVVTMIFQSA